MAARSVLLNWLRVMFSVNPPGPSLRPFIDSIGMWIIISLPSLCAARANGLLNGV